jgi:methoxymalonate biosynthesis acyl carrier protein
MHELVDVDGRVAAYVRDLVGRAVAPDEPIISSQLLESIAAVQLVDFVESELGVTVADEDLVLENFDSVDAIVALARRRAAAA